jgi:hypothetical protein
MKIKKSVFSIMIAICLIGGALLGAVLTGRPSVGEADSKQAKITATGTGIVNTKPDQAKISLGVLTTAPNAEKAQQQNAALVNKVNDALSKAGIAKDKMETKGYSIWPEYNYPKDGDNKPPTISSYRCSNTLIVTVDDIKKAGELIDKAVAAGANQVENIQFQKKDPAPQQREALQKGCKEARLKAEAMAKGLGVKLGEIASVEESSAAVPLSQNRYGSMMKDEANADLGSASTDIQPGELEVSATVTVVFNIK